MFAVYGFLGLRVFEFFLAADAERRSWHGSQSYGRDIIPAESAHWSELGRVRWFGAYLTFVKKFDVLGLAIRASELAQETREQLGIFPVPPENKGSKPVHAGLSQSFFMAAGAAHQPSSAGFLSVTVTKPGH